MWDAEFTLVCLEITIICVILQGRFGLKSRSSLELFGSQNTGLQNGKYCGPPVYNCVQQNYLCSVPVQLFKLFTFVTGCTEILFSILQMFIGLQIYLFAQAQQSHDHFINSRNLAHIATT